MLNRTPERINAGDEIRVVAPALSLSYVIEFDHRPLIHERFNSLGLRLSYGRNVSVRDKFNSSPISQRVNDLHDAFRDPSVKAIITAIGGFNSNELLPYLDWELIRKNPKIFCGYSDITALQNAMLRQSGLVTYMGPHWSTFGMRDSFDKTLNWFIQALFTSNDLPASSAKEWSDDLWFMNQDDRRLKENEGWWILQPGEVVATTCGGNFETFSMLFGTPYMPRLAGKVLLLEDDSMTNAHTFARRFASLLQQDGADKIGGLVIGRFQNESNINEAMLREILEIHPEIRHVPVIANVDFGHTSPIMTVPIGGTAEISTDNASIVFRGEVGSSAT